MLMIMKKLSALITLSAISMAVLCAFGQSKTEAAFEKAMEEYRNSMGNVGLSVVVVKDNRIVYNHNFGYKNLETGEPVTDNTMFRIASISKSFSATSMMQLIEQGKVSLDTDVSTLAGFKIRNPKYPDIVITLEMLMSHTSSLNDNEGYFTLDVINPEKNPDWAKCYNDYAPGKGYEYCNLNFNLTGSFIEKLSGERFDQYVVHHILDPLGLYGGYCVDSLDASRFATLYEWDGKRMAPQPEAYEPRSEKISAYRFGYDTPLFSPTGGMKISALDLARYMMVHMNYGISPLTGARLISEEHSRDMQKERSSDEHYGLALWRTHKMTPVELVGHTGGAYGLASAMFFSPEGKYGFVAISNGKQKSSGTPLNIHTGAVALMYKYFISGESTE